MDRSKKTTIYKVVLWYVTITTTLWGCVMPDEYSRIMKLLEFKNLELIKSRKTPLLAIENLVECYDVSPYDITLWIYQFNNQKQLDEAINKFSSISLPDDQELEFSQNGVFLLVAFFKKDEKLIDQVDMILGKFAGVIER